MGFRVFGQIGELEGDFTCSAEQARHPPWSEGKIWGCEAPSSDTVSLDHLGLAVTGGVELGAIALHWGLAGTYMDMEFQVDAVTYGLRDRTALLADGWTWSANVGASWRLSPRIGIATEVFYSPLEVLRRPAPQPETDGLLDLRTLLRVAL